MKFGLGQFTLQIPPWDARSPAQLYADTLELAAYAESLGFGSFWLAEHHGAQDSYISATLPLLSAVAARTTTMTVGTAVLLAPLHHPIRLAEDAAVVDAISGGRLRLGLGLGWVEDEYRAFGVPMSGRGKRLEEIVAILRAAWTGERFTHAGRYYSFEDVAVTPRPAQSSIPIYLGGAVPAAINRAVTLGDGHFPASVAGPQGIIDSARSIAALRKKKGLDASYRFGCFVPVGFGADAEEGWRSIRDGVLHVRGSYLTWLQGGRDVRKASEVMAEHEAMVRPGAICGTPAEVAETLRPVVDAIHAEGFAEPFVSVILAPPGTSLDDAKARVHTFATQVIPALT